VIVVVGVAVVVLLVDANNNEDPNHEVDHERSHDEALEGGTGMVINDDVETIEIMTRIVVIDRGQEEDRHRTGGNFRLYYELCITLQQGMQHSYTND
jgi:hypothetical protein